MSRGALLPGLPQVNQLGSTTFGKEFVMSSENWGPTNRCQFEDSSPSHWFSRSSLIVGLLEGSFDCPSEAESAP